MKKSEYLHLCGFYFFDNQHKTTINMEIKTKHTLRNRVWVIRNCKATPMEVKYIMISEQGVQYGDETYNMVNESECFPSKEELGKHVMGD